MRRLLVILMLLSFVGIGSAAFAQTAPVPFTCNTTIPRLECDLAGGQNSTLCDPWDWQTGRYNTVGNLACSLGAKYSNRAIFQICNCPDSAINFKAGSIIGVRMTLLVNDLTGERGAYWAAVNSAMPIRFAKFTDTTTACATAALYTNNFGPGAFYQFSDRTTRRVPTSDSVCVVTAARQTTVYVTERTAGYTITVPDEDNALNRWWVEIPLIRIDKNKLHNGEKICVKVEFLNQAVGRGICNDCPPVCEGTICLAIVCCESSSTCFFPYFTSSTAPSGTTGNQFWNGIAIQNTSSVAGTATITAHEQSADGVAAGKVGTFTTPTIPAGSMFVSTLDKITFSPALVGGLPLYIDLTTTFGSVDGFAMMADSTPDAKGESMGYLCRKSCER